MKAILNKLEEKAIPIIYKRVLIKLLAQKDILLQI